MTASLKRHKAAAVGVSIINAGRVTWTGTFGEQASGVPTTAATMFNVASLAKPVTAEVAMRLVSAGVISLDESMATHWVDADIANDPRHKLLTPRIALSHQTGLPNWRFQNEGSKLAFTTAPRNGFTYSGEGYEYLRRCGFSVDAGVLIEAHERAALERLLRYCARPPFACERLRKAGTALV